MPISPKRVKLQVGKKKLGYSIFCLFCLIFTCVILRKTEIYFSGGQKQLAKKVDPLIYEEALRLVPQSTRRIWSERDFLVVFGFPSLDVPMRRWRRHMQRVTCWNFPEVATQQNNYTGAMLVLYLLAKHPMHNFVFSQNLIKEADQWRDIVIDPINEGRSETPKYIHDKDFWEAEAKIGLGRKTFYWYDFALSQFPRAPYFAKGDDDIFLRVPQYLADLRRLPKEGIYWGEYRVSDGVHHKFTFREGVPFMTGYCFTLARDVVDALVSYKKLSKLVSTPYNKTMERDYFAMNMDHGDVMVAWALKLSGYPVIFVAENTKRFRRSSSVPLTPNVLVAHAPKENEYYSLFSQFIINPRTSKPTVITKQSATFYSIDPPV